METRQITKMDILAVGIPSGVIDLGELESLRDEEFLEAARTLRRDHEIRDYDPFIMSLALFEDQVNHDELFTAALDNYYVRFVIPEKPTSRRRNRQTKTNKK